MNIQDIRFLLSAFIQILPAVLSITLIALFGFENLISNWVKFANKKKICIDLSIGMVIVFFLAIISNVYALMNLTELYKHDKFEIKMAIAISLIALFYLYGFIVWMLYLARKIEDRR